MNHVELFDQLQHCQQHVLDQCQLTTIDYRTQYHPELSPAGWHLGHCIYTENYWIKEILLNHRVCDAKSKLLYIPEKSDKARRGELIPELNKLCQWAENSQEENRNLLLEFINNNNQHELMHNDFMFKFLMQHYAQHYETLKMVSAQAALSTDNNVYIVKTPLKSTPVNCTFTTLEKGQYQIGSDNKYEPYDNEHPQQNVSITNVRIATNPIKNSEYLRFMEAGGYDRASYWSKDGWQWLQQADTQQPEYWRKNKDGYWYGINNDGPADIPPAEPVYGINYHEAQAFAHWAEARLPHEYEWEAAKKAGLLQETGIVWEWCSNSFHPYDGFEAFPYTGYSVPYFDGTHFTLKGGSIHTQPVIKRSSFRNYYRADKRFLYAGLRLVFE